MPTVTTIDPRDVVEPWWEPFASAEERACGTALLAEDLADLTASLPDPGDPAWSLAVDVAGHEVHDTDVEPPAVTDADLLAELTGPARPGDVALLASIDPTTLTDPQSHVAYLSAIARCQALLAAMNGAAVVAAAGSESSGALRAEQHVETEVAMARRTGAFEAGTLIEVSRALATTFTGFTAALAAGEISERHCRELVSATRSIRDEQVLRAIEERVLPRARRRTAVQLRRDIAQAIADLDPDAASRLVRARESRRVTFRALEDGLGYVALVHELPVVQSIVATIKADARAVRRERGGAAAVAAGDADATVDATQADAFAARVLGTVADDGSVAWDRTEQPVTVTVVMDLETLRGEADRMALLDGEPVPAAVGREIADGARMWRRAVTDPVSGHLLDYGTEQYLPDRLRRFVLARDGGCTTPTCTNRSADRMQMDHVIPFPEGSSSAVNGDGKCIRCHVLKTLGLLRTSDHKADGSAVLTSAWGQRFVIPPRPFLHDPAERARTVPGAAAGPPPPAPPPPGDARDDTPPF